MARVGEDHEPAVGVEVDEPRGDDLPAGVDPAAGEGNRLARSRDPDPAAVDRHVAGPAGRPRPVDDRAARDEDLDAVSHGFDALGASHGGLVRAPDQASAGAFRLNRIEGKSAARTLDDPRPGPIVA